MKVKNRLLIILTISLSISLAGNFYLITHKVKFSITNERESLINNLKNRHESLQSNFEDGSNSGWRGNVKTDITYQGSKFSLEVPLKNDNFGLTIDYPVLGRWSKVSLDIKDFRDNASKSRGVEIGDSFSNIQIYGGRLGEDRLLLIDDFVIS